MTPPRREGGHEVKRWPIIRHIRWLVYALQFDRWWESVGRHHWLAPNQADLRYLRDVWQGKA